MYHGSVKNGRVKHYGDGAPALGVWRFWLWPPRGWIQDLDWILESHHVLPSRNRLCTTLAKFDAVPQSIRAVVEGSFLVLLTTILINH